MSWGRGSYFTVLGQRYFKVRAFESHGQLSLPPINIFCSDFFLFPPSAKPVRPGHFPTFSPANPCFLRGYSDHPIAFYEAGFHSRKKQAAPAPTSPECLSGLNETNGNQESSDGTTGSHEYDSQEDIQDNAWVYI